MARAPRAGIAPRGPPALALRAGPSPEPQGRDGGSLRSRLLRMRPIVKVREGGVTRQLQPPAWRTDARKPFLCNLLVRDLQRSCGFTRR